MSITRSENMRRIKSTGSRPELVLRKQLSGCGIRGYRCNHRLLPGKPDIYFPRWRLAIFVHGCFWHQHVGCHRGGMPRSNQEYWSPKLSGNVSRDEENLRKLREKGVSALILWECDVLRSPTAASERVRRALTRAKSRSKSP